MENKQQPEELMQKPKAPQSKEPLNTKMPSGTFQTTDEFTKKQKAPLPEIPINSKIFSDSFQTITDSILSKRGTLYKKLSDYDKKQGDVIKEKGQIPINSSLDKVDE